MDVLTGLLLGTAYAAAPGPIIVETVRHGLHGGLRAALAVQGGSALGPLIYGGMALLGAGALVRQEDWQPIVGFVGMALLIYLGLSTIRDRGAHAPFAASARRAPTSARGALVTGAMLSLANPLDIAFWLSIGGAALQQPGPESLTFLGAFATGCVAASLLTAFVAAFWQARLSGGATRTLSRASGLVLIGFGLHLGAVTANLMP